jgi:hypothetical protein
VADVKKTPAKARRPLAGAVLKPGPGRPKGVPNKLTGQVKDMVLQALQGAGGVDYLISCAHDTKTAAAFLGLVGKVIPLQVTGEDGGPVQIQRIELVAMPHKAIE